MYKGFNLDLNDDYSAYRSVGIELYEKTSSRVKNTLAAFKNTDGSLNGSKLRADWFPVEEVDIFISHSHADKQTAINLAGLFKREFNLTSFIDSCVWGHADHLLKLIDNKYCKRDGNAELYAYDKRNYSTAHVHMMLTTALASMMDKAECLFFLNTPQTIMPDPDIEKTESPWIYCEISMSRMLRRQEPKRLVKEDTRGFSGPLNENKNLKIRYDVPLDHLIYLDDLKMDNWEKTANYSDRHPLDVLYQLSSSSL